MRLFDRGGAVGRKRLFLLRLQRVFQGIPERTEGCEETGVEEGEHLVLTIEILRPLRKAQTAADRAGADMVEDRHAFADRPAILEQQRRRLADCIDPPVFIGGNHFRHLDAAEPIRQAGPFQRDDRAEGAALRHAVKQYG